MSMSKRSRAKAAAKARKHQAQKQTAEAAEAAAKAAAEAAAKTAAEAAAKTAAEAAAEAAKTAEAAEIAAAAQTEQWLTTKETLALAQISRTTLHLKTKAGTFPQAIKIGKKCVWIRSEIDRWMNGVTYTVNIK
ncbi:helix-turn-helix transcriptional regulator [Thiolapillus sp.]|uniref:helix-turn-helix transcriptional regulator n=1 Tax=Thiolapillus sp. TaxID=2017437 RepID=UPI003AF64DE2